MKRRDNNKAELKSFAEVDQALFDIAAMQLTADKLENDMNERILQIKNESEQGITNAKERIKVIEKQLNEFCKKNKTEFLSPRSKTLVYGKIGFRTGQETIKPISKKYNGEYITQKFFDLFGAKYVVTKLTLNKEKVISDAKRGLLSDEQLETVGVKKVQGESSFYEIFFDKIRLVDDDKK